ncbi:MAG: AEC family transporter [Lachnospiraceae bacterium]|nr:AEC family transporter [Lachnospiraceae bacterium]
MNVDIAVVFSSLLGLFAIMGVGALAVKTKIIPSTITQNLSSILLKITLPCTVFYSLVSKEYDPTFLSDSLISMGLCFVILALEAVVALVLAKYVLHVREGGQGVWAMACTFCNNGFIGYPIIQSLFGTDGLALAVMYGLVINVMTYSLGIWLVCKDRKQEEAGEKQKTGLRTMLFNNINIGLLIGVIFYFGQIPVPEFVMVPITHFGNMTTPLSMFTTGAIMASSTIGTMLKDKDVYKAGLVRLVLFPILILTCLKHLPFVQPLVYMVIAVTMMMPSPAIATILSDMYHGNRDLAARIVLFSSLCCMITIPLLTTLL